MPKVVVYIYSFIESVPSTSDFQRVKAKQSYKHCKLAQSQPSVVNVQRSRHECGLITFAAAQVDIEFWVYVPTYIGFAIDGLTNEHEKQCKFNELCSYNSYVLITCLLGIIFAWFFFIGVRSFFNYQITSIVRVTQNT